LPGEASLAAVHCGKPQRRLESKVVGPLGAGAATQCINAQALWKMTNAANIETQNATL
jgi:hypothetical protein